MPAIPPPSDGFIIDLLVCRDLGVAHSFGCLQDDVTSLDESLGIRRALNHSLQKLLLQRADMKRFGLRKGHEGSLLHGVLPCILSYPSLPRYFRVAVLEVWDQPPSIQLEYQDRRGRTQRPLHTADYFLFRYKEAGWVECKPTQELIRQARTRPNRYQLDEQGKWRCPPGEAYAAKHGLFYEVYASDQINWAAQDNWLFLEDYYQDLDRLQVAETDIDILSRIVREQPGILLSDLLLQAEGMNTDAVNIAIAKHVLYVDLAIHRLSEPWRAMPFK